MAKTSKTKKRPTLIVDTRERTPWDFEGDDFFGDIVYKKLDAGDYSIEGHEHRIAIERKATGDELFTNLQKAFKHRLYAEAERMQDYEFKIIIIEQTLDQILSPGNYYVNKRKINKKSPKMPPAVVMENLLKLMVHHNIHVFFGGSRAKNMAKSILMEYYKVNG
jgi:ERCC4-type nuclease